MINKEKYTINYIIEPLVLQTFVRESERIRNDICPSVGKEIGNFLYFLIRLTKSKRILEIGTSIGYSTMWLAIGAKENEGHVYTIEVSKRLKTEAEYNIDSAGLKEYVSFYNGFGEEVLDTLNDNYDFIFIDSATKSYDVLYEKSLSLLRPGGLLVFEDALFACTGKRKTQRDIMSTFNEKIINDKRVINSLLNIEDGIMLCMKTCIEGD